MSQKYFDFKKFRINQDQTAMKVCTDSCLFGAWVEVINSINILDIGTGTGLLSLMVAQRSSAQILALEIDFNAFEQAKINFETSVFSNQLQIKHISLQAFLINSKSIFFDTIICNPPFFSSNFKSNNHAINQARHDAGLTLQELALAIPQLLSQNGVFYIILPDFESQKFEKMMTDFEKTSELIVYNTEIENKIFRIFSAFRFKNNNCLNMIKKMHIKNDKNNYSEDFISLLKDYYTIF